MVENELPTTCDSYTKPGAVLERFRFQAGTIDAHERWNCVTCGQGDGCAVPTEFTFQPDDLNAYRIS